jgi:hypothetical protein
MDLKQIVCCYLEKDMFQPKRPSLNDHYQNSKTWCNVVQIKLVIQDTI